MVHIEGKSCLNFDIALNAVKVRNMMLICEKIITLISIDLRL